MTNEAQELIAQARELCERKIAEWQEVFDEASKYSEYCCNACHYLAR